jgi:hypothetical protein
VLTTHDASMKTLEVYYRTVDMTTPQLVCAEHPDFPEEVAMQMTFTPTFACDASEDGKLDFVMGERPDEVTLPADLRKDGLTFTFMLDRSGSMK